MCYQKIQTNRKESCIELFIFDIPHYFKGLPVNIYQIISFLHLRKILLLFSSPFLLLLCCIRHWTVSWDHRGGINLTTVWNDLFYLFIIYILTMMRLEWFNCAGYFFVLFYSNHTKHLNMSALIHVSFVEGYLKAFLNIDWICVNLIFVQTWGNNWFYLDYYC